MKKKLLLTIFIIVLLFSGCASKNDPTPQFEGRGVQISFDYLKKSGYSSNQFAIWVEDADGNLIKTLFVTEYTASGGWKTREQSLPAWVKLANPNNMSKNELDAICTATPSSGKVTIYWDLTDFEGNSVQGDYYVIKLEATLREENGVILSSGVYLSASEFTEDILVVYSGEDFHDLEMISNFALKFTDE